MAKKKSSSKSTSKTITLNKVSFWVICVTAILYLVALLLGHFGISSIIVSALRAVASAIMIIIVAINAWRYVRGRNVVWLILYIVCLLVVIVGIVLPLVL